MFEFLSLNLDSPGKSDIPFSTETFTLFFDKEISLLQLVLLVLTFGFIGLDRALHAVRSVSIFCDFLETIGIS